MGQEAGDQDTGGDEPDDAREAEGGLGHALGLTIASAVIWGIAHVFAGRRVVGFLLMGVFTLLVGGAVVAALEFRGNLQDMAVRRDWLAGITIGILVLALVWVAVVVRSYQVVRPRGLAGVARVLAAGLVVVLSVGVCTPLVWAARDTYTLRDTIGTIFAGDEVHRAPAVNVANPWAGRPRVNILLLGGDGAGDRSGIRTDSMTVASIDTKTGSTVLFSLPRNLQAFPVIPRLKSRWPYGFTGLNPGDEGLLNELFQDAEDDPSLMPGYSKGHRGPELVKEEISYLIGQPIDYYVLVNLFGFADIVDAIGGVHVRVAQDIPYGGPEDGSAPTGVIKAGNHKLGGKLALWYGRSRTSSDDFARMGRQKCLMKDIAEQADPQKVLLRFQKLAGAAKKTISTNIPENMLPPLVKLSGTMKQGAPVTSLMFVPPQFQNVRPQLTVLRAAAAKAIATSEKKETASPTPSAPPVPEDSATPDSGTPTPSASATPAAKAISLDAACG